MSYRCVFFFFCVFAQTRPRANSRSNGYVGNHHGPPAPSVPAPVVPRHYGGHIPPPAAFFPPPPQTLPPAAPGKPGAVDKRTGGVHHQHGNASLHSSNDSGFSNDPPPAPEIDYSDDENTRSVQLAYPVVISIIVQL